MKEKLPLINKPPKSRHKLKIYAPAGNLKSFVAALDSGAYAVYAGFRSSSNLRNFPGINLSRKDMEKGINYVHEKGGKVFITVNNYPQQNELASCLKAVDDAVSMRADGIIVSDLAVMDYAAQKYPEFDLHLSVQAGASNAEAINFYKERFNIKTAILPRVVTIEEIKEITANTDVEIEVFVFGSLCINYEGRCFLSTYVTGESTNTVGTCSSPRYLTFDSDNDKLSFKMNGITLNEYQKDDLKLRPNIQDGKYQKEESETQWTDNFLINRRQICKGMFINSANDEKSHSIQSPVYLNTIDMIGQFIEAGVGSIKIEGRQRKEDYVASSVLLFKQAIDEYYKSGKVSKEMELKEKLNKHFVDIEPTHTCYEGK